jgi:hypothetical protein
MSSSAKWGKSSPVSASSTIVGESVLSERGSVSGVGRPVVVAPGRCVSSVLPGEKPSRSASSVGSTIFPEARGNVVAPNSTCLPVGVVGSSARYTFDGNG